LYGEKALLARINILKSRTSDDPFIPELVALNNKLNEVQNNKTSRTLEAQQNDDPFIPELVALNKEKVKLESNIIDLDSSTINAVQVIKSASAKQIPIKSRNKMIVAIALFGGFIFSIFLVLLTNLFKEDETEPTTK
jgi:LPS O-antigen subunit length determinant protein (WzzB/FepE family)